MFSLEPCGTVLIVYKYNRAIRKKHSWEKLLNNWQIISVQSYMSYNCLSKRENLFSQDIKIKALPFQGHCEVQTMENKYVNYALSINKG